MDKNIHELDLKEMEIVTGGITARPASAPFQVCPRCKRIIPAKDMVSHEAICKRRK